MKILKPKYNFPPHSLEFAKTLPPPPSVYNCRFLYPADDRDKCVFTSSGYPGRYALTLGLFDDSISMAQKIRMVMYQKKVGATCFPAICMNDLANMYPTVGSKYRGKIDHFKLQVWYDMCLAIVQHTGIWVIPSGYCCENSKGYARKNAAEIERVVGPMVTKLDPVVPLHCIAWEASKFWTPQECELVAQIYRKYTAKPIIIQNQGWHHATGKTINGLAYEWHHNPNRGMEFTPKQVADEYRTVQREMIKRGKGVIGSEWTVFTQTDLARRQREAIAGWPGTYGLWN